MKTIIPEPGSVEAAFQKNSAKIALNSNLRTIFDICGNDLQKIQDFVAYIYDIKKAFQL